MEPVFICMCIRNCIQAWYTWGLVASVCQSVYQSANIKITPTGNLHWFIHVIHYDTNHCILVVTWLKLHYFVHYISSNFYWIPGLPWFAWQQNLHLVTSWLQVKLVMPILDTTLACTSKTSTSHPLLLATFPEANLHPTHYPPLFPETQSLRLKNCMFLEFFAPVVVTKVCPAKGSTGHIYANCCQYRVMK